MKNSRLFLYISLLGSFFGMVSDWALLYDPNGGYLQLPKYSFLAGIPAERIWLGHFLGGLSIPLSLFALPALFLLIKATADQVFKITTFVVGFLIVGIVYHMSILPYKLMPIHLEVFQVLEIVCGLGILILGMGWYKIASLFPVCRGARFWANPALTYLVWMLCFAINPNYGGMIWMAGMNLSVLICQITLIGITSCKKI